MKSSNKLYEQNMTIHIPKIKKPFSQRDKDIFLKESFSKIKSYFQNALYQLKAHYSEIDIDFTEVHNFKFISKVYVHGEVKYQCKIWIGVFSSSDSIAYSQGHSFNFYNDNSYNEIITIKDDEYNIGSSAFNRGY